MHIYIGNSFLAIYRLFEGFINALGTMEVVNGVSLLSVVMVSGLSLVVLRNFLFGK